MNQEEAAIIVESLHTHHNDKLDLCTRLEEIADALPGDIDRYICATTAKTIYPTLKKAQEFEETQLFPAIIAANDQHTEFKEIVERLKDEHHEDLCFGEEVRDVLFAISEGNPIQTANATGYMLRGFFEGLRRHMAFEKELTKSLTRP